MHCLSRMGSLITVAHHGCPRTFQIWQVDESLEGEVARAAGLLHQAGTGEV